MNALIILLGLAFWLSLSMIVLVAWEVYVMLRQPVPRIRFVDGCGREIVMDDTRPLHHDEWDQIVDRYYRELEEEQALECPSDMVLTCPEAPAQIEAMDMTYGR